MPDEIIWELWQIKNSMVREYEYDIDMLVAHLQTRQRPAGQKIVDLRAMKEAGERTVSTKPSL